MAPSTCPRKGAILSCGSPPKGRPPCYRDERAGSGRTRRSADSGNLSRHSITAVGRVLPVPPLVCLRGPPACLWRPVGWSGSLSGFKDKRVGCAPTFRLAGAESAHWRRFVSSRACAWSLGGRDAAPRVGACFDGESVCGHLSRHGAWADCVRRRYPPCHAAAAPPAALFAAPPAAPPPAPLEAAHDSRWAGYRRISHAIPQHRIAPRVHIGGIATFVDTVESSLNRIACETGPSERTRAHVGPLSRTLTG